MIKKLCGAALTAVAVLALTGLPGVVTAAGGGFALDSANNDVGDVGSLQRGARNFVNYCMGCHSLKYVRYSKLAEDLQLTEEQVQDNLMFAARKLDEMMTVAMPPNDAQRWFGQQPPDLSLVVRSRGADWVYTFLRSFYIDEAAPTGTNNLVLKGASMPHVLWELQGLQAATFKDKVNEETGEVTPQFGNPEFLDSITIAREGSLSADEYDQFVRDLVNFLDWAATPERLKRQALGIWVLMFLGVFLIFAYLLKVEIWKDVK